MGVDERIHVAFERIRQAVKAGVTMQIAVLRPANGVSKAGAGYLREVEGLRRKSRLFGYVAAPAAVYLLLGTVVLVAFLAFLVLTDAGRGFATALLESPSLQVATFVIAPLLVSLLIHRLGSRLILQVARARDRWTLSCPHCERPMPIQAPWECPYCAGRNEPTFFHSVLNSCRQCRREPEGCYCDKCGRKVALTREIARTGRDDFPCAKPIGRAPPPTMPVDGGKAGHREVSVRQGPEIEGRNLPLPDDPRHELIAAFGLPETASTDDIEAAFEDSKDSDAKSFLARDKEALERTARPATWQIVPQAPTPQRGMPSEDDEVAAVARQRIIMHLGADTRASWSELEEYFDQADSDTKATMNPDDAGRIRRMANAEKRGGINLS